MFTAEAGGLRLERNPVYLGIRRQAAECSKFRRNPREYCESSALRSPECRVPVASLQLGSSAGPRQ